MALGVVTFAVYMIGSSRAFGYDAAVTMDVFVDGPPSWALTRQVVFNNHPLFSLVESLVADVAGTSETTMRVAPVLFAALAVGLLAWRVGVHWGTEAGVTAGLVLASHPLLVPLARDARGYSLAVLCIVVMGVAVFDVRSLWLFAAAGAVGVGTHLYVGVPLAAMVAWMVAAGMFDRRWRLALMAALSVGLSVYIGLVDRMGRGGREFQPAFLRDAGWALIGSTVAAALAFVVLLFFAVRSVRWGRPLVALMVVGAGGVLGPWILAPPDLYDRFVYWAVPGVAVIAAWAVRVDRRLALVGLVAVASCAVPQVDGWARDDFPNRELAARTPADACAASWTYEAMRWYVELREGFDCPTVALLVPDRTEPQTSRAREEWPVVCWAIPLAEIRGRTAADC